jgi:tetratricopeptide (TPR) repeat protein
MTAETAGAAHAKKPVDYSKKLWWLAAIVVPILVAVIAKLPLGGDSPVAGTTYVTNMSVIENEYKLIVGQPLEDSDLKQKIQRAIELGKAHDFPAASALLQEAIQRAPIPALYNNLGVVLQGASDTQRAQQAYRQALATNPTYSSAQANLNRLQTALVDTDTHPVTDRESEPNNDIFHANLISLDRVVSAAIADATDVDYYSFTTPPVYRDRVEIHVENQSTTLAPYIGLYNSDRAYINYVQNTTPAGNVTFPLVALPGTKYFFVVQGFQGTSGAYKVTVRALKAYDSYEPNDDIFHASPINTGRSIEAAIMDSGDVDYFQFKTSKGGNVAITLENRSTTLAPYIALYNSDRSYVNYVQNTTPAGNVTFPFVALPDTKYFFVVTGFQGTSGAYTFTVKEQ